MHERVALQHVVVTLETGTTGRGRWEGAVDAAPCAGLLQPEETRDEYLYAYEYVDRER